MVLDESVVAPTEAPISVPPRILVVDDDETVP
jgi:hypothetical protein